MFLARPFFHFVEEVKHERIQQTVSRSADDDHPAYSPDGDTQRARAQTFSKVGQAPCYTSRHKAIGKLHQAMRAAAKFIMAGGDLMTESGRKARNAYMRQWHAAHPEKAAEYARKWREKNPERVRQSAKAWKEKNLDYIKKYQENYWNKKGENL